MNMNLLSVVTPPSIYHGWYIRKTFWEEKFIGEENFTLGEFIAVNMKCFGHRNVRKHIYIKGSDKYITLDISLKFVSMDKMRITSPYQKYKFGKIRKGVDYFSGSQGQRNAK